MRRGWIILVVLAALVAAACSSESEGSAPSVAATEPPVVQPTEAVEAPTPSSTDASGQDTGEQAEAVDPPASNRQELADTFAELVLADELVTSFMTRPEIICLAEGAFVVFTDERLSEIGLNPDSFSDAYRQPGLFVFGDWFDISDREAFDLENLALGCVDWRNFVVQVLGRRGRAAGSSHSASPPRSRLTG